MSMTSFLEAWGVLSRVSAREATRIGPKYRVLSHSNGSIIVRAPSGADALQIAGMNGRTAAGEKFTVANHKGGGVYEIRMEDWPVMDLEI